MENWSTNKFTLSDAGLMKARTGISLLVGLSTTVRAFQIACLYSSNPHPMAFIARLCSFPCRMMSKSVNLFTQVYARGKVKTSTVQILEWTHLGAVVAARVTPSEMLPRVLSVPSKPLSLSKWTLPVLFKVDRPAKAHLSSPLNSFIPPPKLKGGRQKGAHKSLFSL